MARKQSPVMPVPGRSAGPVSQKEAGRERRRTLPHKSLADLHVSSGDRNPLAILDDSNRERIKHLIPIRYERMGHDPFAFLRGSAAIMAQDLPRAEDTGIYVQLCGDCHLANFGVFATPERNLIFDINDFDETCEGPFEWDVKRLATSFHLAASENRFPDKTGRSIARACAGRYREAMYRFARMPPLEVWYSRADANRIFRHIPRGKIALGSRPPDDAKNAQRTFRVAPRIKRDHASSRIADQPPFIYHAPEKWQLEEKMKNALERYRKNLSPERRILYDRFRPEDVAIKVVGVGSVGTRCLVLLFTDRAGGRLLLQAKEARVSALEEFTGGKRYSDPGERVVTGQRIMQSASDIFLGHMTSQKDGVHYYVRQLHDGKYAPDVTTMSSGKLMQFAELCGWTLACAHARSGNPAMISGYLGRDDTFDRAIMAYAQSYAKIVHEDYEQFTASADTRH